MALTKKKEPILTLEEKLEQAMVPRVKHPYEVPQNWCWTTLGYLVETSKEKTTDFDNPNIKYVGLEHIAKDGGIIEHSFANEVKSLKNVFHIGQILYGKLRPYLNKHDVAEFEGICSTDILVFSVRSSALSQYVDYFLSQNYFIEYAVSKSKGINLPRISKKVVLDAICPLPPLAEQQRIVDRIEGLFSKLDEAKEKAQCVLDDFETRKASILHKAFTGELTVKWRKANNLEREWTVKKLADVAQLQTGLMKGKKTDGPTVMMPYLRVANVQDGFLDLTEIKEIEVDAMNFERYLLRRGDVLFTEGGDFDKLGRGTVWNGEIDHCLHQNHIFVVRADRKTLIPEFLSYQAGSRYGKRYFLSCAKQTTNLASINSTQLKAFPVMIPSIQEQREIVNIIDSLLEKEQEAKEAAVAVLEQIDLAKKSILSRAFRGELGTNNPAEESSIELLRRLVRSEDKT